jgi:3-deoxy-manno-octulosonate cytidylyltransferase (CMP-KDO synthetase)
LSGEPLIHVVAARALELQVADVIVVASDDERVLDAVRDLPVEPILTAPSHRSGTERVAEVVARPEYAWAGIVLNVQGDEPFFPSEAAFGAVAQVRTGLPIGTAATPLADEARENVSRVKVAVDRRQRAVAFSRDVPTDDADANGVQVRQHIGVYAYTPEALTRWVTAPPIPEEQTERLEQLRPLRMGLTIGVAFLETPAPPSVDTSEDLQSAQHFMDRLSVRAGR